MIGMLKKPDGTVVAVGLARPDAANLEKFRLDQFPDSENCGFIPAEELPPAQWRDCWRWDSRGVAVDMPLARAQRLNELRAERDGRLAKLDGQWMRAMGQKNSTEADNIEAKRQLLRDIPQMLTGDRARDGACVVSTLADCKTPEDLGALEPAWP